MLRLTWKCAHCVQVLWEEEMGVLVALRMHCLCICGWNKRDWKCYSDSIYLEHVDEAKSCLKKVKVILSQQPHVLICSRNIDVAQMLHMWCKIMNQYLHMLSYISYVKCIEINMSWSERFILDSRKFMCAFCNEKMLMGSWCASAIILHTRISEGKMGQ